MRTLLALVCLASLASAELVDRLGLIVGDTAITELQVETDLRITAFLNQDLLRGDTAQRRAAASRLVKQTLIQRDIRWSRYPAPSQEEVDDDFEKVRAAFESTNQFQEALTRYGITESMLKRHLALQIETLQFVGFRFRPDVDISEDDLRRAYNERVARFRLEHPQASAPDFQSQAAAIRNELLEQRTDSALDSWLQEESDQVKIVYLDASLRPPAK
jgi:hypothetical protein